MDYVHGYSEREKERLCDQAGTLAELLHHDTLFPAGAHVLEAGCAVGATTSIVARLNPHVRFTSSDLSEVSLAKAAAALDAENIHNVRFVQADVFDLPFSDGSFDHAFACFLLEHVSDPLSALKSLGRVVRPGGTITIIEGDHGSVFFYPRSEYALRAIDCQIRLQAACGGNSLIGRELYPLISAARFDDVNVSPRMVYVDSSKPHLVEGFTRNTFTAMVEGVRDAAIEHGLMYEKDFDCGVRDLYRTAENDGVFCYTFFKGIGRKV